MFHYFDLKTKIELFLRKELNGENDRERWCVFRSGREQRREKSGEGMLRHEISIGKGCNWMGK